VAAVAEVGQGALDAVDALLDGRLRQADEDRLGQAGRDIDFHLDGKGFDADQGEGVQLGEHGDTPDIGSGEETTRSRG
jgi:hypothetical protein